MLRSSLCWTCHIGRLLQKENALEALRFARTELSPFAAKASTADIKDAILDKLQVSCFKARTCSDRS